MPQSLLLFIQKALFKSVSIQFCLKPYVPNIYGTIIRNGKNLGTINWSLRYILPSQHEIIEKGIVSQVQCYGPDENLIARWNFHTHPDSYHFTFKEDRIGSDWDATFLPHGLKGKNLVPLIPIGGIWNNRRSLFSLQQLYAFLVTQKDQQPFWYLIDDHELQKIGVIAPSGGHRQEQFFQPIAPTAPPRPKLQDFCFLVNTEDIEWALSAHHLDPIDPISLCSTLYFEDKNYDI